MSKRKSALGRGLGALLPSESTDETAVSDLSKTQLYNFEDRIRAVGHVSDISLDLIDPNPYQPRTAFDADALDELAASIRQLGIIQPVTVRTAALGRYQLISGERRVRAAELAGLVLVPAYVRDADSEEMLEMALVENVQRTSLNPIEIALGYRRLMDECELTQERVAEKVGKNRATVANFLRLLKLPPDIQAALKTGDVTVGHARALLSLDTDTDRLAMLAVIVKQGLSVRAVEERVKWNLANGRPTPRKKISKSTAQTFESPALQALRAQMRTALSTQVHISAKKDKPGGRIEVEYYSEDDLERLVEIIIG